LQAKPQPPEKQPGLALATVVVQTLPQAPQLLTSALNTSLQVPLQSKYPSLHV
jgi:hypothetical protein